MKDSVLWFFCLMFFACSHGRSDVQILHDEVMEIHDAVMPKMSDINHMQKELKKMIEKLDSTKIEQAESLLADLNHADKIMWDWMHEFKVPDVSHSKSVQIQYYAEEKVKIEVVRDKMLSSIEKAKSFLDD